MTTLKRYVYDCEIINCIPQGERRDDKYKYCEGWTDYENMGISVVSVCAIDLLPGEEEPDKRIFLGDSRLYFDSTGELSLAQGMTLDDFKLFVAQKDIELWGYNSKKFDDKLLRANGISAKTDFDFLEIIRVVAFGSPEWYKTPPGYTYSLGALAEANGFSKTGPGEFAPKLWQQGQYAKVMSYCLNDAVLTAQLIKKWEKGELIDPNTKRVLPYKDPNPPLAF